MDYGFNYCFTHLCHLQHLCDQGSELDQVGVLVQPAAGGAGQGVVAGAAQAPEHELQLETLLQYVHPPLVAGDQGLQELGEHPVLPVVQRARPHVQAEHVLQGAGAGRARAAWAGTRR